MDRRAAPVTLAALYVRVSSREQVDGYSLDAQRRACRDLCIARGYTIVTEYTDEGISAHTDVLAKRPAFSEMLNAAEAGQFTILAVHKMDRFARNLMIQMQSIGRLSKAGVRLISVSEPDFDYTTPMGFVQMGIMGTLAEYYSRNLSEETKKGWRERKRAGLYAGRLPFGTMKGPTGIPVPDTVPYLINGKPTSNHDGLLLAFSRAANGATDAEVATALNTAGYRPNATARRALFARDSTRTILQNRFYVGEIPIGKRGREGWLTGAHDPLVPLEMFDQVQQLRSDRAILHRAFHTSATRQAHALSGLVVCGECGEPMQQDGRAKRLACRARRQGRGCQAKSVAESVIEEELSDYLGRLTIPADVHERILRAYQEQRPAITEHELRRRQIDGQLKRLSDLYVVGDFTKAEYERRRVELRQELSQLTVPDAHGQDVALGRLEDLLKTILVLWGGATASERNEMARTLFESICVRNQRLSKVQPRREFQPYFVLANGEDPGITAGVLNQRARGGMAPEHQDGAIFDYAPCDVVL